MKVLQALRLSKNEFCGGERNETGRLIKGLWFAVVLLLL